MKKLTKKDLINTKWYMKIEESRVLQKKALRLGFKMTSCYVGLGNNFKDILDEGKPPLDCHILYFEEDTFEVCNLSEYWDTDYENYKEMKFENCKELMKMLILENLK